MKFCGLEFKKDVVQLASVQRRAKSTATKHGLSRNVERPGDFQEIDRDVLTGLKDATGLMCEVSQLFLPHKAKRSKLSFPRKMFVLDVGR